MPEELNQFGHKRVEHDTLVFCHRLLSGSAPAIALQQAQQAVRQHPEFAHPYFWSAFSITGHSKP